MAEEKLLPESPNLLHSLLHQPMQLPGLDTRHQSSYRRGSGDLGAGPQEGVVHLVVVQAVGLLAVDRGGSSDPYCKVELGGSKSKTRCRSRKKKEMEKLQGKRVGGMLYKLEEQREGAMLHRTITNSLDPKWREELNLIWQNRSCSHRPGLSRPPQLSPIIEFILVPLPLWTFSQCPRASSLTDFLILFFVLEN